MTPRSLLRLTALALAAPALSLVPPALAHAAGRCHGQTATIEASTGSVTGTPGADVIVVTGTVESVSAGEGDDLICLVDTDKLPGFHIYIYVDPGAGDDVVDASEAGARTDVHLGPGVDTFTGSTHSDYVQVGNNPYSSTPAEAPGPYAVTTGPGPDTLVVGTGAVVDAHLGTGADGLSFYSSYAGPHSRFDLGAGEDHVGFEDNWADPGAGDTTLRADLVRGRITWRGVTSALLGAEDVGGYAKQVVIVGGAGPNRLLGHGCDVVLKGGAGDDSLYLSSAKQDVAPDLADCSPAPRLRAYGNAGDDRLEGGRLHDVLIGGAGVDRADGGNAGHDRCQAEHASGRGCRGH